MRALILAVASCSLALGAMGCGSTAANDPSSSSEDALTTFDIDNVMSDDDLTGGADITEARVQTLLDHYGSFLAGYTDPGLHQSAAAVIVERSRAHGIHPLYMLARIQGESSLIQSGSSRNLAQATGCACPDGSSCSHSRAGFGAQVECSALFMRQYLDELEHDGETRAGWKIGVANETLDPCRVTPANAATAAIYTYTPWVGDNSHGCGRRGGGGAALLLTIYLKYKAVL